MLMNTSKPNQANQGFGINIIVLRNLIIVFMKFSILTDKQSKYTRITLCQWAFVGNLKSLLGFDIDICFLKSLIHNGDAFIDFVLCDDEWRGLLCCRSLF